MVGAMKERVALVTGASSGIGAAIAAKLASNGYEVIATARRMDRLQELGQSHSSIVPICADLTQMKDLDGLFEQIRQRWGGVDVVINNAGVGYKSSFLDPKPEQWRQMLELNVLSLSLVTSQALSPSNKRPTTHIVNIASLAGHRVPGTGGIYSATKFAVVALTESLRRELRAEGSRTRVTSISPGIVSTEFFEHYCPTPEARKQMTGQFDSPLTPSDIAEATWYALSAPVHVDISDILIRPVEQTS